MGRILASGDMSVCYVTNESWLSLSLAFMSCDAEWLSFARSIKVRLFLPESNSISPEWVDGFSLAEFTIVIELLPVTSLSAPTLRKAVATLEGGGGPTPSGGDFATGRALIDHPGADENPVVRRDGGDHHLFGLRWGVRGSPNHAPLPITEFPEPMASRTDMGMYQACAMRLLLVQCVIRPPGQPLRTSFRHPPPGVEGNTSDL